MRSPSSTLHNQDVVRRGNFEEIDQIGLHVVHDIRRQRTAMAVLGHTTITRAEY